MLFEFPHQRIGGHNVNGSQGAQSLLCPTGAFAIFGYTLLEGATHVLYSALSAHPAHHPQDKYDEFAQDRCYSIARPEGTEQPQMLLRRRRPETSPGSFHFRNSSGGTACTAQFRPEQGADILFNQSIPTISQPW